MKLQHMAAGLLALGVAVLAACGQVANVPPTSTPIPVTPTSTSVAVAPLPTAVPTTIPTTPPAPTVLPGSSPVPTTAPISDEDAITAVLAAFVGDSVQIETITVDRIEGDYARGMVVPVAAGPGIFFLQRSGGTWNVIGRLGNTMLTQEDIDNLRQQGIPESLLSDLAAQVLPPSGEDDEQAIAAAVYAFSAGSVEVQDITVERIEGEYARAAVAPVAADAAIFFLQRGNGTWNVVGRVGAPVIEASELDALREQGVPEDLFRDLAEQVMPPAVSDEEQTIAATVYAYLGGEDIDTLVVERIEGDYARVAVTGIGVDPAIFFVQRSNGEWNVIGQVGASGIEPSELDALRQQGVPESLLSDLPSS